MMGDADGRCPDKRAQQIGTALSTMPAADFTWRTLCHCLYRTHAQVIQEVRNYDSFEDPHRPTNLITVNLRSPIELPALKEKGLERAASSVIVEGVPGGRATLILLGHRHDQRRAALYPPGEIEYVAYFIPGDLFDLDRPRHEC